jgi:HK97 family phage prohead protease
MIELKYFDLEIKVLPDKSTRDKGIFEGYANVFDILDSGDDIVHRGSCVKTLSEAKGNKTSLLYMHDRYTPKHLLGGAENIQETGKGLYSQNWISLKTDVGAHTFEMIREDIIDRESIGFKTIRADTRQLKVGDSERWIRDIYEMKLKEISVCPVHMAMNDQALITDVKSIKDIYEYIKENACDLEFKNKILSLFGIKPELLTTLLQAPGLLKSEEATTPEKAPEEATTLITEKGFYTILREKIDILGGF